MHPAEIEIPKNTILVSVHGGYAPATAQILSTLYHDNLYALLEQGIIKVRSNSITINPKCSALTILQPNQVEVIQNGLAGIPEGLKRLETGQISKSKLVVHLLD